MPVYAGLVALCALAGYWLMFSQFEVYDDEGFFDYSLHLFASGHPLYTRVFSDYGPFYYELFGGFFALIGHSVTTDSGRLIQLVLWVGTSLGIGLVAQRVSGRLAIGVTALATAFLLLNGAVDEPMHASMLTDVLLTATVVAAAAWIETRTILALTIVGALAAALLLTKINIGGYAIIGIAFAAVMAGGRLGEIRILRWLVTVVFVLIGPLVMIGSLGSSWAENYALLAVLSSLALVFVAVPGRSDPRPDDGNLLWAVALIGGFLAVLTVVIGVAVGLGTHIGDLVQDILVVPTHQTNILTIPIPLADDVIWWSLTAASAAWIYARLQVGDSLGRAALWDGSLRVVAGVAILLSLGDQTIFQIAPSATFSLAMPLAWVAALPSPRQASNAGSRMLRLLLPALAITEALVAYPVAGTQVGYGSILFVPCAAVCLSDGWSELAAWGERSGVGRPAVDRVLSALLVILAVGTTWEYIVQPLSGSHHEYEASVPLDIPGATRLRLSPTQREPIQTVVAQIAAHGCRTLISYPGMYSFDIWTGLPWVSGQTGEQPYWRLLSYSQQLRVLQQALRAPGLCAIRNDTLATMYGGRPERSPIVKFIDKDFVPVASASPYELEVRRPPT